MHCLFTILTKILLLAVAVSAYTLTVSPSGSIAYQNGVTFNVETEGGILVSSITVRSYYRSYSSRISVWTGPEISGKPRKVDSSPWRQVFYSSYITSSNYVITIPIDPPVKVLPGEKVSFAIVSSRNLKTTYGSLSRTTTRGVSVVTGGDVGWATSSSGHIASNDRHFQGSITFSFLPTPRPTFLPTAAPTLHPTASPTAFAQVTRIIAVGAQGSKGSRVGSGFGLTLNVRGVTAELSLYQISTEMLAASGRTSVELWKTTEIQPSAKPPDVAAPHWTRVFQAPSVDYSRSVLQVNMATPAIVVPAGETWAIAIICSDELKLTAGSAEVSPVNATGISVLTGGHVGWAISATGGIESENNALRGSLRYYSSAAVPALPWPYDTKALSDTSSARRHYGENCLQRCQGDVVSFSTCNGDSVGDTILRLFDGNGIEVAMNDDDLSCPTSNILSTVYHIVEPPGCHWYCLRAGCYGAESCRAVVNVGSSAAPTVHPTVSPTPSPTTHEPTPAPTLGPTAYTITPRSARYSTSSSGIIVNVHATEDLTIDGVTLRMYYSSGYISRVQVWKGAPLDGTREPPSVTSSYWTRVHNQYGQYYDGYTHAYDLDSPIHLSAGESVALAFQSTSSQSIYRSITSAVTTSNTGLQLTNGARYGWSVYSSGRIRSYDYGFRGSLRYIVHHKEKPQLPWPFLTGTLSSTNSALSSFSQNCVKRCNGQTVTFSTCNSVTFGDPYLRLFDEAGSQLEHNDDGLVCSAHSARNSHLEYTVRTPGCALLCLHMGCYGSSSCRMQVDLGGSSDSPTPFPSESPTVTPTEAPTSGPANKVFTVRARDGTVVTHSNGITFNTRAATDLIISQLILEMVWPIHGTTAVNVKVGNEIQAGIRPNITSNGWAVVHSSAATDYVNGSLIVTIDPPIELRRGRAIGMAVECSSKIRTYADSQGAVLLSSSSNELTVATGGPVGWSMDHDGSFTSDSMEFQGGINYTAVTFPEPPPVVDRLEGWEIALIAVFTSLAFVVIVSYALSKNDDLREALSESLDSCVGFCVEGFNCIGESCAAVIGRLCACGCLATLYTEILVAGCQWIATAASDGTASLLQSFHCSAIVPDTFAAEEISEATAPFTGSCFMYDSFTAKDPNCFQLRCGCKYHTDCFLGYVRSQLSDSTNFTAKGIRCGYLAANIVNSGANDGSIAICANNGHINISTLEALASYCQQKRVTLEDPLTTEEMNKFVRYTFQRIAHCPKCTEPQILSDNAQSPKVRCSSCKFCFCSQCKVRWHRGETCAEFAIRTTTSDVRKPDNSSQYIEATSKACPQCSARTTHYHGHSCHHIQGCKSCKTNYCYACLSTAEENERVRGGRGRCTCPGQSWSGFCRDTDIEKHLKQDPYPHDTRCGCPICPDCRPGRKCPVCNGRCVVCTGKVPPGGLELVPKKEIGQTTSVLL